MVLTRSKKKTIGNSLSLVQENSTDVICCKSCNEAETDKEDFTRCDVCVSWYHVSCIDMSPECYEKLKINNKQVYLCPNCEKLNIKKSDTDFQQLKDEIGQLKELIKDSNGMIRNVNNNVGALRNEMLQLNKETDNKIDKLSTDVHDKINVMSQEIQSIKDAPNVVVDVEKVIPALKESLNLTHLINQTEADHVIVSGLELAVDRMERINHSNNIVLDGIPKVKNENLFDIYYKITDLLGVKTYPNEINAIFRLNNKSVTPSIIICFLSKSLRDQIFTAYLGCDSARLSDIGFNAFKSRFYMNEHLIAKYSQLFKKARELKSKGRLAKCYTRNGIVYVARGNTSKPMKIMSEDDLRIVTTRIDVHRDASLNKEVEFDTDEDELNETVIAVAGKM